MGSERMRMASEGPEERKSRERLEDLEAARGAFTHGLDERRFCGLMWRSALGTGGRRLYDTLHYLGAEMGEEF